MNGAPERGSTLVWSELQSLWQATDMMMLTANSAMFLLVALSSASTAERATLGLAHLLVMGLTFAVARGDKGRPQRSPTIAFVHDWLPALFVASLYFELGVVIPHVHPLDDYRYDRVLQAFDVRVLGDPAAFFAHMGSRWLSDLLAVCYNAYYPLLFVVPATLYARGAYAEFRTSGAIIISAFLITYAGYFLFPALGPHILFDGPRAPVLDGFGFAQHSHAALRAMRFEPPDAFPSGHALMAVLVPALAWRWTRGLFVWVTLLGAGIVLATLYLRYHYLLDVIAAFALAPVAWRMGEWVDRRYADRSERAEVFSDDLPARRWRS